MRLFGAVVVGNRPSNVPVISGCGSGSSSLLPYFQLVIDGPDPPQCRRNSMSDTVDSVDKDFMIRPIPPLAMLPLHSRRHVRSAERVDGILPYSLRRTAVAFGDTVSEHTGVYVCLIHVPILLLLGIVVFFTGSGYGLVQGETHDQLYNQIVTQSTGSGT